MYLDPPIWHLKEKCPCCNQNSNLELYTCDICKKIIAICDEMFTNFMDPLNITMDNIAPNGNEKDCPHCMSQNSLRPAKDVEIIALGLTVKEYE
jgi:hypothetical protein